MKNKFTNTDEFQVIARNFYKNGNMYTLSPKGTSAHREFWEGAKKLCLEGMTNSAGIYITGPHFFYLNFTQILAKDEVTKRKTKLFPRFLDIDHDFFMMIDQARREEKGVILVKPRRTGFSYKNASLVTHEYNFYKDSKCIIGAYLSKLSENTMGMVLDNMNFLNTHTEWVRPRNPDTREFVKSAYKVNDNGVDIWKGNMSEVRSITFKDNPFASIGQTASLFIWEEAGKFENLIEAFNLTEPCWKDGEDMIGIPIVFGTGGDMEGGTRDFHEMFYNPEKYNFLAFENKYDEGAMSKCGYFLSATRGRLGGITLNKGGKEQVIKTKTPLVDKDGNSNEELALQTIMSLRENKKTGDPKALRDTITQYPLSPREAFLRAKGSIFPAADLQEHLADIEIHKEKYNAGIPVTLKIASDNSIVAKPDENLNPITDFPLKSDDLKEGAVVIWENPFKDDNGNTPYGLYVAGCDPYDQDKADSSTSLGSVFIYKTFLHAGTTNNIIVAEYTGRPEKADDFYETIRRLLLYYNAKCLYENQLKGLKGYFETKNCLYLLYEQPQILKDIVKDSKVNRGYGIHMTRGSSGATGIKDQCELYLKQWLLEERVIDPEKNIVKCNLHTILSKPLLKELIAYDRDGNFDRVISFMLCILQLKENHKIVVQENSLTTNQITNYFADRTKFYKKHNILN